VEAGADKEAKNDVRENEIRPHTYFKEAQEWKHHGLSTTLAVPTSICTQGRSVLTRSRFYIFLVS
jgi:hypothetical protein